ncbi:MAG TPA: hypothetical protein VHA52_10095 [Candidatus Babeliaceae bacterium]|nr:hypothetical protein [Candidatus Babeliaceae bacterium]
MMEKIFRERITPLEGEIEKIIDQGHDSLENLKDNTSFLAYEGDWHHFYFDGHSCLNKDDLNKIIKFYEEEDMVEARILYERSEEIRMQILEKLKEIEKVHEESEKSV